MELYPLTMCYFIERTQKCTKLFFNHYQEEYWIANHVEYQEALDKCSELQGELKETENELQRLLG